jgi:hypothetical protein
MVTEVHCWDTGKRAWIKGSRRGLYRIDELGASDRCRTGLFESYWRLRAWEVARLIMWSCAPGRLHAWSCDPIGHLDSDWPPWFWVESDTESQWMPQGQPSRRSAVCTGWTLAKGKSNEVGDRLPGTTLLDGQLLVTNYKNKYMLWRQNTCFEDHVYWSDSFENTKKSLILSLHQGFEIGEIIMIAPTLPSLHETVKYSGRGQWITFTRS